MVSPIISHPWLSLLVVCTFILVLLSLVDDKRLPKLSFSVSILALFFSVLIPFSVLDNEMTLQNKKACLDSTLELREKISDLLALPRAKDGKIVSKDNDFKVVIQAQVARDSVRVLCSKVPNVIDGNLKAWSDSPKSLTTPWYVSNAQEIYNETTRIIQNINS